jgi:Zn-dependent protease with chaperone function
MHTILLSVVLFMAAQQSQAPGINFFSPEQDIEIGAESAREAEKSLPLVRDSGIVANYVRTIGGRLARHSSATPLQFRFRVVNSEAIDSFTFPGGVIFINRGLIELTENQDELAAIIAHEMAHAVARHGTSQLSRQLLVQSAASVASGLAVRDGWKDQLSRFGISFGAKAAFLHYSAAQEVEANLMAVQILTKAGYEPYALTSLLDKVVHGPDGEAQTVPQFLYSHPQSDVFEKQPGPQKPIRVRTDFTTFQTALSRLPYPTVDEVNEADVIADADVLPNVYSHPEDFYKVGYPEGWQVTRSGTTPNGAIIAPLDGIQSTRVGSDLVRGVMFDLFDVSERPMTLAQATDRLMVKLRQRNINDADPFKSLRMVPGAQAQTILSGEPGLRTVMIGRSSDRDSSEIVWVVTRMYYQSLFYIVCVAPEEEFIRDQATFEQIIRSVQLR